MPVPERPWGQAEAGPPPRNHMAWAILSSLLCCLPLGVVAIVYSSQVRPRWAEGQYVAAVEAATRAKRWGWIAAFVGFFVYALIGATWLLARNLPQ